MPFVFTNMFFLLLGLGFVLLLYCVSWILYRKGWFLRF